MLKKVLSNAEIECLGSEIINHYFRGEQYNREWVDIDSLVQTYLGLQVVYVNIKEKNEDKVAFLADGKTTIRIMEYGKIRDVCYPENTIVLDRFFLNAQENDKRRFTLAHEAGHYILNRAKGLRAKAAFRTTPFGYQDVKFDVIADTCNLDEVQANRIAAVLLMPEGLINQEMIRIFGRDTLPLYGGEHVAMDDQERMNQMCSHLQVSYSALKNRLKELGKVEWRPYEELLENLFSKEKLEYEPW